MKIVTSGLRFLDIDGYACCIAYAELLNLKGGQAQAVSTSQLNESVPATVRTWDAPLATTYTPTDTDTYVLVDVSEPEHFDKFVAIDRVVEVIDHHLGFEAFWTERLGDKAQIEFIGAACTQVYENWKRAGLLDKMSVTSARLLVCGILDNTLNFGAQVSTPRDRAAYEDLLNRADLPSDWPTQHFSECQQGILSDTAAAIKNDTKLLQFNGYADKIALGQLVVWDGKQILGHHKKALQSAMTGIKQEYLINLVGIAEGKSYFLCNDPAIQAWLSQPLHVTFTDDLAVADRLWLRKEIIKADLQPQRANSATSIL